MLQFNGARSEKYFFSHSTRLLAATTLRNVLGTKVLLKCVTRKRVLCSSVFFAQNLAEILSERESIAQVMQVEKFNICVGNADSALASSHLFVTSLKVGWSWVKIGKDSQISFV